MAVPPPRGKGHVNKYGANSTERAKAVVAYLTTSRQVREAGWRERRKNEEEK